MLVSITILSIGLIAGSLCLSVALTSDLRANRIALATELAQNVIENQRSLGDLTSLTTEVRDTRLPGGLLETLVSDYNAQLKLKRLRVTVSWIGKAGQRESVMLETIVSKRQKHVGG